MCADGRLDWIDIEEVMLGLLLVAVTVAAVVAKSK